MRKALQERPQGALPSNTIPNPQEEIKEITTRSGNVLAGPSVPLPALYFSSKEVERDPEMIMDKVLPKSTVQVPPLVVQPSPISRSSKLPPSPASTSSVILERNPHQPLIPYPSSLAESLALMPKYAKMLKDLLSDKEKLLGLENTSLTENCSAVLLKKLPEKHGDPGKFLIPYDFPECKKCMALANLGASINLMPLSVWKKLMLPELIPTRMTLELANRSVTYPTGIAEDVYVQEDRLEDQRNAAPTVLCRFIGNSFPSSSLVETSVSLLEEFADKLALLDPFSIGNEDDNFDPEADLREIKYLLNLDPLTDSSPTTDIDIINPILERFTDEPALIYSSPPGDDDDDVFDLKSDNEEWKKLLYGDLFDNTHLENEKDKDFKIESLIDDMDHDLLDLKSDNDEWKRLFVLLPQLLDGDLTLHEELLEIDTLTLFPFGNKDKVFNPGILVHGSTQIVTKVTPDKSLTLEESNFLSHSSDHSFDRDLIFFLESTMTETLLLFSSKNKDKVFNPEILILKGVHPLSPRILHQSFDAFKVQKIENKAKTGIFGFDLIKFIYIQDQDEVGKFPEHSIGKSTKL
ncbi:reverse transcriptase domain-containing protein [Tanacetum coccineum]